MVFIYVYRAMRPNVVSLIVYSWLAIYLLLR
jgi:hypothetical protein